MPARIPHARGPLRRDAPEVRWPREIAVRPRRLRASCPRGKNRRLLRRRRGGRRREPLQHPSARGGVRVARPARRAQPRLHASIRARRKAVLDTRAAYSSGGESVAFVSYEELSILLPFKSGDGHDREGRPVIQVETATLDGIFAAHGVPGEIDYLSVDPEGSELEGVQRS